VKPSRAANQSSDFTSNRRRAHDSGQPYLPPDEKTSRDYLAV
jgi:hypothetical protein